MQPSFQENSIFRQCFLFRRFGSKKMLFSHYSWNFWTKSKTVKKFIQLEKESKVLLSPVQVKPDGAILRLITSISKNNQTAF